MSEDDIPTAAPEAPSMRASDYGEGAAFEAKQRARASKANAKRFSAQAKEAKLEARLAKQQAKILKLTSKEEKAGEDAGLAAKGLRRQWITGRIVPVKQSRRARAHQRRLAQE